MVAGTAWLAGHGSRSKAAPVARDERLPREVWVATVAQEGVRASTPEDMTKQVLATMREIVPHAPDIICLPETFLASGVSQLASIPELAEEGLGSVIKPFADFANEHNCYIVCPVYTKEGESVFNSAVFIDREGEIVGSYHKLHPTTGEIADGVAPGPTDVPVFQTDFGKVGAQICFDIQWRDGWQSLAEKGAEIVFWPSAFGGGAMLNSMAWQHQFSVVSSTLKSASRICDITGEEIAKTSRWNNWICAPINLEKEFLHTWPYVQKFDAIQAKYGRDVRIQNFADEEWSILESRSANVKIADVMKEFDLKSLREHIQHADGIQCDCRQ